MRKILLLLILSLSVFFANAQNVAGDELRIYKDAQIGEDGNATINMHNNRVQGVADPISLLDAVNLQYFTDNMSLTQPLDSLSFTPLTESDIQTDYTMFADTLSYSGSFKTGLGNYVYKLGQSTVLLYYNDNAYTIEPFDVLHLKSGALVNGELYPTPELADASDWEKTQGTLSVAAHTIPPGSFGFTVIYGTLKGGSTLGLVAGSQLWLTDDGTGNISSSRPAFQSYAISVGGAFNAVAAPNGQIFVNITRDIYDTFNDGWDGAIRETFNFTTSSDGISTITGTLENVIDTKNLTLLFSDGFNTFDTTPAATLTLVAGTATTVQLNYVFIDKATKTLQASTGGFPVTEHAKIALVGLFDAATTLANGAIRNQNINDHIKKEDDNGHILHIAERLRQFNAEWDSGGETILSGTPTNLYFSSTSANVYQLHLQQMAAQDMALGDDIHVVNDPDIAYRTTTNLNDITEFSDGTAWNNQWSNLVVWGVCNKSGEISHLMVNLPSDGYTAEIDAFNDNENFTDYNIPKDFKGVGFLMGRFTIRRSGGTFTYNLADGYLDLRGFIPNNTAGSGGGGPSGITTLLALTDTPGSYIGFAKQALTVTDAETGTQFSPVVLSVNGGGPTLGDYIITSTANKIGEDVTIGTSGTGIDAVFSVADGDNTIGGLEFQTLTNSKLNNSVNVTISNGNTTTITDIARTAGFLNPTLSATTISATPTTTSTGVTINGATGIDRALSWGEGVNKRWQIYNNQALEVGGNSGSNLEIASYSDTGTLLEQILIINRSGGKINLPSGSGLDVTGNIDSDTYSIGNTEVLSLSTSELTFGVLGITDNYFFGNVDAIEGYSVNGIDINAGGLSNVAYLNQANVFTEDIEIASSSPKLMIERTDNVAVFDAITLKGTTNLDFDGKIGFNSNQLRLEGKLSVNVYDGVGNSLFSGGLLNVVNGYKVGGTAVIDASRNIVNAGSITASGAVTGSNLSNTNTGDNAVNTLYSGLISNVTTNLSATHNSGNVFINSSDGTNATLNGANVAQSGVVTATNQSFAGEKTFIDPLTIEDGFGRIDLKSTSLLALPINTVRFLDANGVLAQEIQGGNGVDNIMRIINEKEGVEIYHAGSTASDVRVSTTANGVSINSVLELVPLASAPSSPSLGWIYTNSTDNHIYFYNGSTWVQMDN